VKLAPLDRILGPVIALATALSLGSDWSISLWSARLPWIPSVYQDVSVGASDVGLAALVLYVGLVARRPGVRRWSIQAKTTLVGGGFLIVFLAASTVGATAPFLSLATLADVGLGLATYAAVVRRADLARWLLAGFGCLVLLELPLVVLDEVTQSRVRIVSWPNLAFAFDPASVPGANVVFAPDGTRWQRAIGSFPHPNVLGGFLAVVLVLALPALVKAGWPRASALFAVWAIGWVELVLTFSRAALLAAVVGCGIWLIAERARKANGSWPRWLIGAPIVALALGGAIAGPFLLLRLAPTPSLAGTAPVTGRLMLGQVAVALIRMHPLFGVGGGNFTLAELAPPFDAIAVDPVHAVPLLVAAEAGVPAALAWLALVFGGSIADWRRERTIGLSLSYSALPIAILILALLDHYLWTLPAGRATFWLGLAIWAAARENLVQTPIDGEGKDSHRSVIPRGAPRGIPGADRRGNGSGLKARSRADGAEAPVRIGALAPIISAPGRQARAPQRHA
jgi:O-antigen ligase